MNSYEIINLLEESKDLPKVPAKISDILDMLKSPNELNIIELSQKLSKCNNLEKYIISFINCGYFRLSRKINSIKEAITYLGMQTLKILIITHITKILLPDNIGKAKIFNNRKYWNHILGTSVASEIIYEKQNQSDKYRMFSYGLIHDIGIAVMDICIPEVIDNIVEIEQQRGVHQIIAERQVMGGITHADIGAWLCKKWGLPEDIQSVVEFHHRPHSAKINSEEVNIIHIGDLISSNYYERLLGINLTNIYPRETLKTIGITENDIEAISKVLSERVEIAKQEISF